MKSKTSFFNRTLFLNLLKRYWPIFAGYFLVWLIVLPIALTNILQYNTYTAEFSNNILAFAAAAGRQILNSGLYGGVIISGIFGLLIAMAAFNYLYNARSVSMICSLPIKREGTFFSVFSSGLVTMFTINLFVFLISLSVTAAYGVLSLSYVYLLQWLAMVCMLNLFFFGFASLIAGLTGHILVLPMVYIVLNFTVYVVEMLVRTIMGLFIYGFSGNTSSVLAVLSPPVKLLMNSGISGILEEPDNYNSAVIGYNYTEWKIVIIYAAVGVLFALLAMLLIKHRRMETAGDVVAVKPLRPIFKYCLSGGCALVLGLLIFTTAFNSPTTLTGIRGAMLMLAFMLFGAFIGYFAAEMLMQKTLHVFKGGKWIGFGITAVLISAFLIGCEFDVFGIESKLPAASEVKGVSINSVGEAVFFEEPESIASAIKLHSDIITHKDANEQYTGNYNVNSYYVTIIYTYNNGNTLTREYQLYSEASDDIYALNDLMNVKEAIDFRKELSVSVSIDTIADAYISYFDKASETYANIELSPEMAYQLYSECIIPDIEDCVLGKIWIVTDETYNNNVYDCTVNFSVEQRVKDNVYNSDYFYTTLNVDSKRTNNWITENCGITLATMGESSAMQYAYSDGKVYAEKAAESIG